MTQPKFNLFKKSGRNNGFNTIIGSPKIIFEIILFYNFLLFYPRSIFDDLTAKTRIGNVFLRSLKS